MPPRSPVPVLGLALLWCLIALASVGIHACYTGQGPKTVCNPADFGCTQPFGMPVVDGGAG